MDSLLEIDRNCVLAVTKTTNANILSFSFVDGSVDCKWVIRDKDLKILRINELPYLEKLLVTVNLDTLDDGRVKVTFGMPIAMDDRDLFFCKLPDTYIQSYGIVFEDSANGPSFLKEVFVDIEASVSYCRCVSLTSGHNFVEKIGVNLGLLKNFL